MFLFRALKNKLIYKSENFRSFFLKFSTKLLTVLKCWYTILADIEKEC